MVSYEKLLSPGKINSLTIKNRIIMPPMGTALTDLSGQPTDKLIELFARRAQGGAGMLITEQLFSEQPDEETEKVKVAIINPQPGLQSSRLYDWVEAVKVHGCRMCAGLTPLPGRWMLLQMQGKNQRRDEFEAAVYKGLGIFNKLSTEDLQRIIEQFATVAGLLKSYGFDAIEIAFTMLCDFFSQKDINKRQDKYAFQHDNGLVFTKELIQETRRVVGDDFPIMLFMDVDQYTPGWRTIEDSLIMVPKFEQWGIDSIRCRAGTSLKMQYDCIPQYLPEGAIVHHAAAMKQKVNIPVIANGKLSNPEVAEKVLEEGKADFISIARGLLADPDLPKKLWKNQPEKIRKCLSCNIGCLGYLMGQPVLPFRCSVNPLLGNEEKYRSIDLAHNPMKVVVVGAGPAGMSAALTAAQRGHVVTLFEKTGKIGGGGFYQLSCIPPLKHENLYLAEYYEHMVGDFPNVNIQLNTEANSELILAENPDVVIIATGARWEMPELISSSEENVVSFIDLLLGRVQCGEKVIIVGGGSIGCETGHFLIERGKEVVILEMLSQVAGELPLPNRNCLLEHLTEGGAEIITEALVTRIVDNQVHYQKDGKEMVVTGDSVVATIGSLPNTSLYHKLITKVGQVEIIGDAKQPRLFIEAVREGFFTAYHL